MSRGVDVLAVRWVAEIAVAPNGMHEIRAGAVNARERPLVGYVASYGLAHEIASLHNSRLVVLDATFECPCCGDDEATPAFGRKVCTACVADELERRIENGDCDDSPALPEARS